MAVGVAAVFAANAGETTITFADVYGTTTQDIKQPLIADGFEVTFEKGNSNNVTAFNKAGDIRLYAGSQEKPDGNIMTVKAPAGVTITGISLTAKSYEKWGVISVDNGTFTEDATTKNGTWAGSAASVKFTASRSASDLTVATQNRYTAMSITYTGEAGLSGVKFSLAAGDYFGAQQVEISSLAEGAEVAYTVALDGTQVESKQAASPVSVSLDKVGTYVVTAKSVKGSESSAEQSATYVIKERQAIAFTPMDPANVKEGKYIIAYSDGEKSYVMKNEVYSNYYVAGTEFDLSTGTLPTAEYLFDVKAVEGGYNIVNNEGKYVSMVASGSHINLKPSEADAAVWTFEPANVAADGAYAVKATVPAVTAEKASYLQFQLYRSSTPEFLADSRYQYPTFYSADASGVEEAAAEVATVYTTAGAVVVKATEPTAVEVYNAAGQAVALRNAVEGETSINVPAGFYIVKAGTTVAKVVVK